MIYTYGYKAPFAAFYITGLLLANYIGSPGWAVQCSTKDVGNDKGATLTTRVAPWWARLSG